MINGLTGNPKVCRVGVIAQLGVRDFVAEFNNRLSKVLDHLIKQGISDPEKIAACGTSRGGFLALHAAIHDPRVKCVAGFAPVTDLSVLREFKSTSECQLVKKFNLINRAKGSRRP